MSNRKVFFTRMRFHSANVVFFGSAKEVLLWTEPSFGSKRANLEVAIKEGLRRTVFACGVGFHGIRSLC